MQSTAAACDPLYWRLPIVRTSMLKINWYAVMPESISNAMTPLQSEGRDNSSFIAFGIEQLSKAPVEKEEFRSGDVKGAASAFFFAGTDTVGLLLATPRTILTLILFKTVASLESILFHLVRNPEVLKKAQKEIDEVIGSDVLPDFNDREHLPYVERIIWEALRHAYGSKRL
jgi:hypothetical protein